jgi:hypothetical protein
MLPSSLAITSEDFLPILGSGRPINPPTGFDANRSGAFPLSSRPLGFGRNSLATSSHVQLDLRVLKFFKVGEHGKLDFVLESFNLLNHRNVVALNQFYGPENSPIPVFTRPNKAAFQGNCSCQLTWSSDGLAVVVHPADEFEIYNLRSQFPRYSFDCGAGSLHLRPKMKALPQSSSVGKVFNTSLALGRLRTGSSLRIFPSRKTSTRLANCAMSCS